MNNHLHCSISLIYTHTYTHTHMHTQTHRESAYILVATSNETISVDMQEIDFSQMNNEFQNYIICYSIKKI